MSPIENFFKRKKYTTVQVAQVKDRRLVKENLHRWLWPKTLADPVHWKKLISRDQFNKTFTSVHCSYYFWTPKTMSIL